MTDSIKTAADTAVELFRRDLIANLRRSIAANERALAALQHVLLGDGWVVRSAHGLVIDFDTERVVGGAFRCVNPRPASAAAARRFSKADAQRIADATRDGTGEAFEAVHVTQAIADNIEAERKLIEELQAAARPQQTA